MAKDLSVGRLLDIYGCFLSEKQRTLAEYYYNDDLSLAEIAENEGTSRQAVCELLRRAENQMNLWESKCRYLETVSRIKALREAAASGNENAESELYGLIDTL